MNKQVRVKTDIPQKRMMKAGKTRIFKIKRNPMEYDYRMFLIGVTVE